MGFLRLQWIISVFLFSGVCSALSSESHVFKDFKEFHDISKYQMVDVRSRKAYERAHLKGSLWIDIGGFDSPNPAFRAQVGSPFHIQSFLRETGLRGGNPVLIIGESIRSFGEDGRLYWILDRFTDLEVMILNGGFQELEDSLSPEHFEKGPGAEGALDGHGIEISVRKDIPVFGFEDLNRRELIKIDVRTLAEFMGATPFGSDRGGHIPGAAWLPWHSFFDERGRVKPEPVEEVLKKIGGRQPLVYCTAGYRSALVYAVLKQWGLKPINYDGSWYDYASRISPSTMKENAGTQ